MAYHLAQLNIARFKQPADHPDNAEFMAALNLVNEAAENNPGYVWRLVGEGNDATDIDAFDDPHVLVNMSVWTDLESLAAYVYRNDDHLTIMRRRREWFDRMEFYLVLWWIEAGHLPSVEEAKTRLADLTENGPNARAFSFRHPFPPPGGDAVDPVLGECA